MKLIGALLINTLALLITSYLIPGFTVLDIKTAIIAAVVIGIINTFIKPILHILTFPITIVTLGLFLFVINLGLLYLAAYVTPGFEIVGLMALVLGSIALSLISSFLGMLTK